MQHTDRDLEQPATNALDARSVFVVHGRDVALRDSMFAFLRSLDLKPIEWTHAVALTGKAAPYIGEVLDAAFSNATAVVVLMTPDEVAYLRTVYSSGPDDPDTQPASQARPNVLFEAGLALGRHPDRTVLVEIGDLRPFSDVAGRHMVRLSNEIGPRQELARRLKYGGLSRRPVQRVVAPSGRVQRPLRKRPVPWPPRTKHPRRTTARGP